MSPRRIQRIPGVPLPEGAIYVGPGSRWANMFLPVRCDQRRHFDAWKEFPHPHWHILVDGADKLAPRWATKREAKEAAVRAYRLRVLGLMWDLSELAGHDLACRCPLVNGHGKPSPCHADVLLDLANKEIPR